MEETRAGATAPAPGGGGPPTLALLLNAFWRRGWLIGGCTALGLVAGIVYGLVIGPLYRATATVRPGIVSYSSEGAPVREWRHKDIVNWFDKQLYWQDLREDPALAEFEAAPRILTEFLPAGGLYQEGGDVIVLEFLSGDASLAARVLDAAVESFNEQAAGDSTGSTLNLTRIGLELTLAELEVERATLEVEQAKLEREISRKLGQARRLAGRQEQAGLDAAIERTVEDHGEAGLASADSALASERERLVAMRRSLDDLLRRDDAGGVGDFALATATLDVHVFGVQTVVDSMRALARRSALQARRYEVERDEVLAADRAAVEDEAAVLRLQMESELPLQIAKLEQQIRSEEARRDLLAPLERIGSTQQSDRPVRPRKLRAIFILTGLAFAASLFLALAIEYVSRHREVVFARPEI